MRWRTGHRIGLLQGHAKPDFDPVHRNKGAEALDVAVAEEEPPGERLVIGHRQHDDDKNEIGFAGDVIALLDFRRGCELRLRPLDLIAVSLITSTSTKIVMDCPTASGATTETSGRITPSSRIRLIRR